MAGTLEKGSHQQALDLSEEELPPHQQISHHSATAAVGGGADAAPRGVVPPPYSAAGGGEGPLELRGSLDCWACSVLVTAQNLIIAAINSCLAGLVFGTVLTPAIVMVVFGFLCHSTVRPHGTMPYCSDLLTDGGCVALLVVGFLLVTPLLVLALAAYCRLARHLQLGLCFIPYSRAVYKNPPASRHRGLAASCCGAGDGADGGGKGKVWKRGNSRENAATVAHAGTDPHLEGQQLIRGERERSPPLPEIMQSRFPHLGNSQGSAPPKCNGGASPWVNHLRDHGVSPASMSKEVEDVPAALPTASADGCV
ncbi:LOW QUALITY PROTEIN: transmembrane protein 88 b [Brachionichthys hirsutus]|uniref:LOW QUALITY PROTEIN: transmembrane protein 88 b n=1 Tax=Brachionichthys hirsutus TaxID=412623 RepID=UPI003604E5A0